MSDETEMQTELLKQVYMALDEAVGVLRGIEGILDTLTSRVESIEENTLDLSYRSHNIIYRAWFVLRNREAIKQFGRDGLGVRLHDTFEEFLANPPTADPDEWPK